MILLARKYAFLPLIFCFALLTTTPLSHAQDSISAPCGVVDAIDYPIDNISQTHDDFGLYRARFDGNHTGIDIGFGRWGDPVRAAARGRVTYSDVEGWDTEKGVVIIEHTFPDGSIYYTLYGHVEQSDTIFLPQVGECVERGKVIAAIGWPSRGAPHLHYEIRDFLPDDGGPGYISGNPLDEGWYHPFDFTQLWRARLSGAFVGYVTFKLVPTLPPVLLDSGMAVIASGNVLEGVLPPADLRWRVETDGVITGLVALPGDAVVAHTRSGQVVVLRGGRYAALWTVHGPEWPLVLLEGALVFVTDDGGLAAYDPAGSPLWTLPGTDFTRIANFEANATTLALGVNTREGVSWRLIDAAGQVMYETEFDATPLIASRLDGSWLALADESWFRIADGERESLADLDSRTGRAARMVVDAHDNVYIYMGNRDRTLLSLDSTGEVRWRIRYPHETDTLLPPVLHGGDGCLFYTLDADGMLNVFASADGKLLNQMQFYAGGSQSSSPPARLLRLDADGHLTVGSGFLTVVTLDAAKLADSAGVNCAEN